MGRGGTGSPVGSRPLDGRRGWRRGWGSSIYGGAYETAGGHSKRTHFQFHTNSHFDFNPVKQGTRALTL